jgi:hypothetical protein
VSSIELCIVRRPTVRQKRAVDLPLKGGGESLYVDAEAGRVDKPRRPSYVSRAAVPWHFLVAFPRFYASPAGNGSTTLQVLSPGKAEITSDQLLR